MAFPQSPRVVFRENPIEEVICQLRFPTILKVDAEPPADFQERIRSDYPLFEENSSAGPGELLPAEVRKLIGQSNPGSLGSNKTFKFHSESGTWTVSLNRDFLAISTSEYTTWEIFSNHLEAPLRTLVDVYQPAFFSRIGLRYRDVIKRSRLGLDQCQWSELIAPAFAGELSDKFLGASVRALSRQTVVELDDGLGLLTIRHGLGEDEASREECFIWDTDFYRQSRTEIKDADETLNSFNELAGSIFRHSITPKLRDAMGPQNG